MKLKPYTKKEIKELVKKYGKKETKAMFGYRNLVAASKNKMHYHLAQDKRSYCLSRDNEWLF